jgi:hypothetical protein
MNPAGLRRLPQPIAGPAQGQQCWRRAEPVSCRQQPRRPDRSCDMSGLSPRHTAPPGRGRAPPGPADDDSEFCRSRSTGQSNRGAGSVPPGVWPLASRVILHPVTCYWGGNASAIEWIDRSGVEHVELHQPSPDRRHEPNSAAGPPHAPRPHQDHHTRPSLFGRPDIVQLSRGTAMKWSRPIAIRFLAAVACGIGDPRVRRCR